MLKISASLAMLKIMESWRIHRIYGYPAGSVSSLMEALRHEKQQIQYVQVRHEQVGALAAAAHAKLTGRIGVVFGSAGPGAVNLLDGLYDARADHAPVLAIAGQANDNVLNYDYFQAMPELPVFNDVACYCRCIMNPESLPHVTDRAIRAAYFYRGVAVIVIPNNWGFTKIPVPKLDFSNHRKSIQQKIRCLLKMIRDAQRPVFHVGSGIQNGGPSLLRLSRKLQIPVVIDGLAKPLIPGQVADLGTSNHDVSKPANEIFGMADLVIDVGADYSFSPRYYRRHPFKLVQIEPNAERLGNHHWVDLSIHQRPLIFLTRVLKSCSPAPRSSFYRAAQADVKNWRKYLSLFAERTTDPICPAQIYRQINRIADPNAVFSVDIGDNLINSFRYLKLGPKNRLVFSAQFATMGCSLPGAIAAQLDYPHRQVFSLTGDGAFSMVMQDLVTLKKYHLPVINVVTSNGATNYIREKQADLAVHNFGNRLAGQDFAAIAKAMGIHAVNVLHARDLSQNFDLARRVTKTGKPFLINVKITPQRILPVENLRINPLTHTETTKNGRDLRDFFNRYCGQELRSMNDLFQSAERGTL